MKMTGIHLTAFTHHQQDPFGFPIFHATSRAVSVLLHNRHVLLLNSIPALREKRRTWARTNVEAEKATSLCVSLLTLFTGRGRQTHTESHTSLSYQTWALFGLHKFVTLTKWTQKRSCYGATQSVTVQIRLASVAALSWTFPNLYVNTILAVNT